MRAGKINEVSWKTDKKRKTDDHARNHRANTRKKKKEISTTPASKSLVLFNLLLSLLPILNKLINKSVH